VAPRVLSYPCFTVADPKSNTLANRARTLFEKHIAASSKTASITAVGEHMLGDELPKNGAWLVLTHRTNRMDGLLGKIASL